MHRFFLALILLSIPGSTCVLARKRRLARHGSAGGRRRGTSCSRSSDAGLSTGGLAGKCLPEPGEIAGVDIGDSAECQAGRTPGFHGVAVT
jgi:hypothetical protein